MTEAKEQVMKMSRAFKCARNKDLSLWSTERLQQRIRECQNMEQSVTANKARRSWKEAKQEAEAELASRSSQNEVGEAA